MRDDKPIHWIAVEGEPTEDELKNIRDVAQDVFDENEAIISAAEIAPMTEDERREYIEQLIDALDGDSNE